MSQVVCIKSDNDWTSLLGTKHEGICPIKGQVYTISGHTTWDNVKYYYLAEMGPENAWDSRFFKPLKKTDISCFTRMLKTRKMEDA